MKVKNFISEADSKRIEEAVANAEKSTSGEIVPAIVESSARYDWIGYRAAILGWVVASLLGLWLHLYHPFVLEYWETQALQVAGLGLGWGLSRFRFVLRWLVSEESLSEEVLQAAHVCFVRNGLMNTRDRTGVLVFVSLRERRVQIIGDKGIHEKVGDTFWADEVRKIAAAIGEGRAADGMVAAIGDIGSKLSQHFPRSGDDRNELSDSLQRR